MPSAAALRNLGQHLQTLRSLAGQPGLGIDRGVYRFTSHAEAQAQMDAARARLLALAAQRLHPDP